MRDTNNPIRLYLKEISKIPLLTREEERELGHRALRGDPMAIQKLVESNLRFVIKIAKKFQKSGLPLQDLINEGNVGLIEAARRFDPDRNVRFTSYAIWWIRQSLLHFLSECGRIVRVPPKVSNILYRVARATEEGIPSTRQELAERLGISMEDMDAALALLSGALSIDQPLDEDGELYLSDRLEQKVHPSAETLAFRDHLRKRIDRSLKMLSETERKVVEMRFGLENDNPKTLREIGEEMNLSRERIRQIESHALGKIRRSSNGDALSHFVN